MEEKQKFQSKISLLHFIRPYLWWYLVGWVFLFLSSSAGLVFPYLMGKLLGSTTTNTSVSKESIELLTFENATDVAFALFILFALVKAIVPRYRYDQLMRLGWKVFLPFSLTWVVLTASYLFYFNLLPVN